MASARASIAEASRLGHRRSRPAKPWPSRGPRSRLNPAPRHGFRGAVRAAAVRHDFRRSRRQHRRPPCRLADHIRGRVAPPQLCCPPAALASRAGFATRSPARSARWTLRRLPPGKIFQSCCRVSRRPAALPSPMGCSARINDGGNLKARRSPSSGGAQTAPPSPISGVPCAKPTRSSTNGSARPTHRSRRAARVAQGDGDRSVPSAAALLLFVAGAATRDQIGTPAPARDGGRPRGSGCRRHRARKRRRKNPRSRPGFGRRSRRPRSHAARRRRQRAPRTAGFFARLHLQWLKKALS